MPYRWLLSTMFLLVLGCWCAGAQTAVADSTRGSARADVTTTDVAPDDVVETIHGFCDNDLLVGEATSTPAKPDSAVSQGSGESVSSGSHGTNDPGCKTVITRAQFEKMATFLDVDATGTINHSNRIKFAVHYPETLLFAAKAIEAGIDKEPGFEMKVKYSYLQLLSQVYTRRIREAAANISDEEFASEYKNHPELFERVDLLRIFIPKQKHHTSGVEMLRDAAADETAMKAEADRIRKKALAGASFEKLEKEAYAFAGEDPDGAPSVDLSGDTRSGVERQYQDVVFHLKVGEISDVVPATEGWHIFKLVSKSQVPMSEAKNLLVSIRVHAAIDAAKAGIKTDFNDAYFNVPGGMEPAKPGGVATKSSGNHSE
jgi:hypothetical protein